MPMRRATPMIAALMLAAVLAAQETASRPANHLASEKSPYLRQHANNPVDWHAWGDAAFAKAARENKPVFLSIGYASCHWCHVMEKESFEDRDIAAVLNESFVAIKVDREERPDVDRVYMIAATAMIGRGGWPLNVFLTPDRLPFFAGTYFPLEDQPNQTGFKTVVASIRDAWRDRRATLEGAAARIAKALATEQLSTAELEQRARGIESRTAAGAETRPEAAGAAQAELAGIRELIARRQGTPARNLLKRAGEQLILAEDKEHGGFGEDVKFPAPAGPLALLRLYARGEAPAALAAVKRQCDAMARGAIRDHLAGGFHRYATDRKWQLPHFEKMLYDQALLARLYLELWQVTGEERYETVCRETIDFVLGGMAARGGGFIAALDATVGGEEGATYLWTRDEIERALDGEERALFLAWSGFDAAEQSDRITIAARRSVPNAAEQARLTDALARLLAARAKRPQPAVVGHVITGWNAWMVSALARAGAALNVPRYVDAAASTMAFLESKLRTPQGLFARRLLEGEVRFEGELSDHAAVIEALLDLHEATLDRPWLDRAIALTDLVTSRFGRSDGSFDDSVAADLIFRTRELSDGAVPSGVSQMNLALVRIARITGDPARLARARRAIDAVVPDVAASPSDHAYGAIAWDLAYDRAPRVVFGGPRPVTLLMRAPLLLSYMPSVSFTAEAPDADRARAVVWIDQDASPPVTNAAALITLLSPAASRPTSR